MTMSNSIAVVNGNFMAPVSMSSSSNNCEGEDKTKIDLLRASDEEHGAVACYIAADFRLPTPQETFAPPQVNIYVHKEARCGVLSPEVLFGALGWTTTCLAMSAQACFGVILLDFYFFSNLSMSLRIIMDSIFFLAVEESKRRVVSAHNQNNFRVLKSQIFTSTHFLSSIYSNPLLQELAHYKWRSFFERVHWTGPRIAWHIYIGGITFGGSHLFVAITALNLDGEYGAASLFRSYQSKSCDSVATILDARAFQVLYKPLVHL